MGDTIPRRLEPTDKERTAVVFSRMAGGSDAGQSRFSHPVPDGPEPQPAKHFAVIEHGSDASAPRPFAELVRWAGSATEPTYAAPFDDIYPADL